MYLKTVRERKPKNKVMSWNTKLIEILLLIITVVDLERFNLKDKPITYTEVFVKLYNWRNYAQVHKIY